MYRLHLMLFLSVLFSALASAQFEAMSLERLVREADVIVSGAMVEVKTATERNRFSQDTGLIRVTRLLHNTSGLAVETKKTIRLNMPATGNKVQFKTDVRFAKGASGIWLLRRAGDVFVARHPSCLQAAERLPEINRLRATRP